MTSSSSDIQGVNFLAAYYALGQEELGKSTQQLSKGSRETFVEDVMKKNLPINRIKAKEDDLSDKYQAIDCSRKKRKKIKSKCPVEGATSVRKMKGDPFSVRTGSKKRYKDFIPLRDLWLSYMEDLMVLNKTPLNLPTIAQRMVKADLHGCPMAVRKSVCPNYVGICGIVIQETRMMFVLVTRSNEVKSIPKKSCEFSIQIKEIVLTIHGKNFLTRPGERAARKWKMKYDIDL